MVVGVVFGIGTVFVLWLLVSGIIHIVSEFLGADKGEFRQTFRLMGWGFLPQVIGSGLSLVAIYYVLQNIPNAASATELQAAMQSAPVAQISTYVGLLFIFWQGFLWLFAVRRSRGLSIRNAGIVVAIPTGAQLALTLLSIV